MKKCFYISLALFINILFFHVVQPIGFRLGISPYFI